MAAADGRGDEELPRDAKVVETILRSMGVQQHEPRVINQFLDLWYRYVGDVLADAQAYSEHAGKSAIDCDDARLAVQSRVNSSFSQPPPREILMKLAKARNNIPLPKVIGGPGIALPPDQDTLIAPNYQLALPARVVLNTEDMEADLDESSKSENEAAPNEGQYNSARKVSFALAAKRPKT